MSRTHEQFHGSFLGLSQSLTSLSGVSLDARSHRCLANSLNGALAIVRLHSRKLSPS